MRSWLSTTKAFVGMRLRRCCAARVAKSDFANAGPAQVFRLLKNLHLTRLIVDIFMPGYGWIE